MRRFTALALAAVLGLPPLAGSASEAQPRTVVLLHGLARSADSMLDMEDALKAAGYLTCNIDYPSTDHPIQTLASVHILPTIRACADSEQRTLDFVTHSMGGIIVRHLRTVEPTLKFGRVVMLGPPSKGSEVVDKLGELAPFEWINGPAGQQLGTDEHALPRSLGATDLEVGVIAGEDSINPILSLLIPGEDDGKVSLENARLDGMADFLIVPVSHPFLMTDQEVITQTLYFLEHGAFEHDG
ncbi:esterase/lipase family protein [Marinobacter sp. SS21]|uniref:esterase/lipase family protein n=1 Tax=Marinobacter sp. SS21 TaxID=2979460 RepID=UPI00232DFEB3|nr:alpha/beta fold hydrolase [Marinobacter sp. SS21]MDC0662699.1 alpha/beta fold hydrolase [Marinobacter sp. SS21]